MNDQSRATAVVSLYNPNNAVVARIESLLGQVGHVVAVDDGSPQNPEVVLATLERLGVSVVRLTSNSGIAAALNAGITKALAGPSRPEFILTMDQDSLLPDGYLDALVSSYEQALRNNISVGMVAPGSIGGLPTRRRGSRNSSVIGGEPIQSGLLIPTGVLDQIGLMLESLFIDGVDTEFYLRARQAGLESVLTPEAKLEHTLGSKVTASIANIPLRFRGNEIKVRVAANDRYYYIFRNRIFLVRRFARTQPIWAVKGILADYRHLAIVSALAPGRGPRLAAALQGIKDGLAGVSGRRLR